MSRLEKIRLMKMYHNLRTNARIIDELDYYHERIIELIRSYLEEDTAVPQKETRLEKIRMIKEYVKRMMDSRSVDEIEYLHERIMALIQQLKDEDGGRYQALELRRI